MKKILNVSTILLLVLAVMACKQPTGNGGGSGTGGGEQTPRVILNTYLYDSNITPTIGIDIIGTWSITDANFDGSNDAEIALDGTTTTYADILTAIQNEVSFENTTVLLAYNTEMTGTAQTGSNIVLNATLTANNGYIFEGSATTKVIPITFDIYAPPSGKILIPNSIIDGYINVSNNEKFEIAGTWTLENGIFTGIGSKIISPADLLYWDILRHLDSFNNDDNTNIKNSVNTSLNGAISQVSFAYLDKSIYGTTKVGTSTTGVKVNITLTASSNHVFYGGETTKVIEFSFDIEVP